ncbi:MAG: carbon-nitrogen hydrolase family protein, partial [Planctomycetes bacterium]|nr:carbon-nitrogen hydrolase family protein [Planctomycetota bacterium]
MMSRTLTIALLVACIVVLGAGYLDAGEKTMNNLLEYDGSKPSGGWEKWSPREEVALTLSEKSDDGGTLIVEGNGLDYGISGWQRSITDFKPGDALAVHAEVTCRGMVSPLRSLWIRIYWLGRLPEGTAPDVIRLEKAAEGLYVFDDRVIVPEGAVSANVRLIYRWEPAGEAAWKNISMTPAGPEKTHRKVRISTVYWRSTERTTVDNNLEHFLAMVDKAAADKPDIVVLGEGVMVVGVGFGDMDAVSEEIPGGRFFNKFAEKAKQYKCCISYGTYERDGRYIFNTAVLIGPDGKLAGKYRKAHLPIEEDIAGLAPGDSIDVFDTPLGKIGMAICIESRFPEVVRTLTLKGAEIVLIPIWGGREKTIQVRARENGVYVVTSSFDMKCIIVDPRGNILAETGKGLGNGVATAVCDLDDRTKS